MIAKNAQHILDARLQGKKPVDMVIISLVGPVGMDNPTVFADPGTAYDWRWCRGLDVCVYLDDSQDWPDVMLAIARARPQHMNLWSHNGKWGAKVYLVPRADDIGKPVRQWKFELDFMPWQDFQNADFINCTTYERDKNGMPHAVNR